MILVPQSAKQISFATLCKQVLCNHLVSHLVSMVKPCEMNNIHNFLGICALLPATASAQCDDAMACNFDPSSQGMADCLYFDTELFDLEERDFIGNYEFEECENGLAGWNDLEVDLYAPPEGGPLALNVSDFAAFILLSSGLESLYDDLTTASISVCSDTMNYISTVQGELSLGWDGQGFENAVLGGYIAPESSYPSGCSDPDACNFESCPSPADTGSCQWLTPGTIIGDSLVTNGTSYTYNYAGGAPGSTYVYYTACGEVAEEEQGGDNLVTFVFDFPTDCELCVEEIQPTCSIMTCLTLTPEETNLISTMEARWSIGPNPAQDALFVTSQAPTEPWAFFNLLGQEMKRVSIRPGANEVSLEGFAHGTYLFGPLSGPKSRIQVLD